MVSGNLDLSLSKALALEEQTRAIIRMTEFGLAGSEPFDPVTATGGFASALPTG